MTDATALGGKVFALPFSKFGRWDPASYKPLEWHWPEDQLATIGSVLTKRTENKVDKTAHAFEDLQPITIHFDGSIDKRVVAAGRTYSMDLYSAEPGNVVVAKIDLKNGAVGVIPAGWNNVVVTSHFAVYEPDIEKIRPAYFQRIIQASFFKDYLWRNKVGAEGRKEVKLDFFEATKIPLPGLDVQDTIVARWDAAEARIVEIRKRIQGLEEEIAEVALSHSGIQLAEWFKRPKACALLSADLSRWGVEFNRWTWTPADLMVSELYETVPLCDLVYVNPATSTDFEPEDIVSFVPMEAVSDVEGAIIQTQERGFFEVRKGYTRFQNGDVIWAKITPCMQNGKSAVVRDMIGEVGFGSTEFHVLRVRDCGEVLPEYLWILLRLEPVRQAAKRYFAGSAGQQRVPQAFLEALHIPKPPIAIQQQVVNEVLAGRHKISVQREAAQQAIKEARNEVDNMVLGKLPVPIVT